MDVISAPAFRQCRAAARSVYASQHSEALLASLRPRSESWFFKSRAPLPIVIYRAGLEGRLLWWSPEGFAIFDETTRRAAPSRRAFWIRQVDEGWALMWPIVALASLLPVGLVLAAIRPSQTVILGYVAALGLALAFLALTFVIMVFRGALDIYRQLTREGPVELNQAAIGQLRGRYRAVSLTHIRPTQVNEFVNVVLGFGERVLILGDGVSSSMTRRALAQSPRLRELTDEPLVWVASGEQEWSLCSPSARPALAARGIPLIIGGGAIGLLISAYFVADAEKGICGTACEGQPANYGTALYWLLNRLSGGDPEGIGATHPFARAMGLLWTLSALILVGWVIATLIQQSLSGIRSAGPDLVVRHNERYAPLPSKTAEPIPSANPPVLNSVTALVIGGAIGFLISRSHRPRSPS